VTRGEFYSSYTPYQAEASQGTLQVLYEYQSMMTALTALDVTNASLYDGASALAEAVLMSVRLHKTSRKVLMPRTVNPAYRSTVRTIVRNQGIELIELAYDAERGHVDPELLNQLGENDIAALVIPQPNFFGVLEPVDALTDWARAHGALAIGVVNPLAAALLKPPGQWGARVPTSRWAMASRSAFHWRRRALLRFHGLPQGAPAADAGKDRWAHDRQCRPSGIHADPAGARAAHPPIQGDLEYLHQSRAHGHGIDHSHGIVGRRGAAAHRSRVPRGIVDAVGQSQRGAWREARVFRSRVPRGRDSARRARRRRVASASCPRHTGRSRFGARISEMAQGLLVCVTETKNECDLMEYAAQIARIMGKRFTPAPCAFRPGA